MSEEIPDLNDENFSNKKVFLLLLDGWGVSSLSEVNAIAKAKAKNFNDLVLNYPVALLKDETTDPRKRYFSLGTGLSSNFDKYLENTNYLSKILAENNLKQLKLSSAYSFSFLNLYFNALNQEVLNNEKREIVKADNLDYFQEARLLFKMAEKYIDENEYDFTVLTVPLADQMSSLGDFKKTVKAINLIDDYLLKISQKILNQDNILIVSSVYGNAEYTKDLSTETLNQELTKNPVPIIIVAKDYLGKTIGLAEPLEADLSLLSPVASLNSIMPSILKLFNIKTEEKSLF